ncbi:unnamed protein product [Vicia faba]|uniref:Integrase catalytic domain-containing protein n=1 Tax=Vicia faba TaxID=3906 RepID=A0AAV1A1M0_VICFA|nr:unnamed protein product [Vicia faba]
MIQNQFGVNIKRIRSDNGKEFFNHVITPFCEKEGIIHESSCVKTPQQNGIAERKNGHLLDQTRALLFQNNVPKYLWGEVVLTATYLINRLPSRVLELRSPMDILSSFYPNISTTNNLVPQIFECVSFVHIHSQGRGKLDPKALKCVFVGDVTFHEGKAYFTQPYLQGESLSEDKSNSLETLILPNLEMNSHEINSREGMVGNESKNEALVEDRFGNE